MSANFDVFVVHLTAGNLGIPDKPILNCSLLVHAATGKISGQAQINQFVAPPGGHIVIHNLSGQVRRLGFGHGPVTQVFSLEGTFNQPGPPPTHHIVLQHFRAHFATDSQWNGRGGFEYGAHDVEGVPIRNSAAGSGPIHTLYGVVIHEAIASGDLARMKEIAAQAERHINATPDIQAALTALKAEIAKAGS